MKTPKTFSKKQLHFKDFLYFCKQYIEITFKKNIISNYYA
jgi:hypothetical protein